MIPPTYVIRADRNLPGIIGLAVGTAALMLAVIPIVGIVAWFVWPIGLVLSGLGIHLADRNRATNRNVAVAGLVVSMLAALACVWWAAQALGALLTVLLT